MDERTVFIFDRFGKWRSQSSLQKPGFWGKFLKRTAFRVNRLAQQPVENTIYYILAGLPVPMWSEQDAEQVTDWLSRRLLRSNFKAPQLPNETQEMLMRSLAVKEFKRFLAQDPEAKFALMQHYQEQHGKIPMEIHRILPRPPVFKRPFGSQNLVHNFAQMERARQGRPLFRKPQRFAPGRA